MAGTTKTEKLKYSPDRTALAEVAKAFAHPARIQILELLASRDSCVCGEIVDELPLAQSTVSQHLNELKKVGLITGETSGPRVCYCLNTDAVERFHSAMTGLFERLEQENPPECCP